MRVDIADYYVKDLRVLVKASLCPVLREVLVLISHLLTYLIFLAQMGCKRRDSELKFNCIIL